MNELKNKITMDIRSKIKYLETQEQEINKCDNWIDLFYIDGCYDFQVDILKNTLNHGWFKEAEIEVYGGVIEFKTYMFKITFFRKNRKIEITDYSNEKLLGNKELLRHCIDYKNRFEKEFNIVEKFIKNNKKYSKEWFKDYSKLVDLYVKYNYCSKYEAMINCTNYFDNRWLIDCIDKIKKYENDIKTYEEKIRQIETNANETDMLIKEIIEIDLKQFTDNIVVE